MIVKLTLVDGTFDIFESEKFNISTEKDMNPYIIRIDIFAGTRKIFKWKRRRISHYKKHFIPPKINLKQEN